jgi:tRNA threonylcarbamoyladenosine biosynthesis protein TsaE
MPSLQSSSSTETKKIAAVIAQDLLKRGPDKHAFVLALEGDLGAGKTTFVQGFFMGLGVKRVPNSPTFILMRRTALSRKTFKDVFHIDAYRVDAAGFKALGLGDILKNPQNIVLIEWPERVKKLLPKDVLRIKFAHGSHAEERKITLPHSL